MLTLGIARVFMIDMTLVGRFLLAGKCDFIYVVLFFKLEKI